MVQAARPDSLFFTEVWVLISAWSSLAGWALSFFGYLNLAGYLASFIIGVAAGGLWLAQRYSFTGLRRAGGRLRWQKVLPWLFAFCALLALIGGAIYPANNYDSLTYRFPRVLHWLAEGKWHWISTNNLRMNMYSPGMEWLTAPIFVFTKSDRSFFLLNWFPYLLLPGLLFSMFHRLGVSGRVAWQWMWLIPCGYCFALQAGGSANDCYGLVYCLGAIIFALRTRETNNAGDFVVAATALALTTGAKGTNLPLLLPMGIAFLPALRFSRRRWGVTCAVAIAASLVSFVPQAVLNHIHTGNWTGDPLDTERIRIDQPLWGMAGNLIIFLVGNLTPPIFPWAASWNAAASNWMALGFFQELLRHYRRFSMTTLELPGEDTAGMGLLFFVLVVLAACYCLFKRRLSFLKPIQGLGYWIGIGGIIAFLVLCAKLGAPGTPRYAAIYYPLMMLPLLLGPANLQLIRTKTWKALAIMTAASTLVILVLLPSRPLWPWKWVVNVLQQERANGQLLHRVAQVYSVYEQRSDNLAELRRFIPAGARLVGFIGSVDDAEVSLWRPFSRRRVIRIFRANLRSTLSNPDLHVIVASGPVIEEEFGLPPETWIASQGGRILGRDRIAVKASVGPLDWFVFELPGSANHQLLLPD